MDIGPAIANYSWYQFEVLEICNTDLSDWHRITQHTQCSGYNFSDNIQQCLKVTPYEGRFGAQTLQKKRN